MTQLGMKEPSGFLDTHQRKDQNSIAANGKNGATKKQKFLTAAEIYDLVKTQEFKCALTGRELNPQTASIDHMQPLSRGGEHSVSNLQVVHYDVNQAKGTMTQDEFIAMCREVVGLHG
jgi:5-methylcytosine-specific restriction endonuclease McrA